MSMDPLDIKGVSPWLQTNWDARAAGNFIGGGAGTGLLAVAAMQDLAPAGLFAFIALAFVGFGLLCVWLEIGRPWRAINVFFHPQTSWMTREGLVAMPLFALGGLVVLFGSTLAMLGAALVGLFYLYCQARIVSASKGIPAWRHPAIVPALISMGLAEGAGIAMILAPGQGGILFILLIALRLVFWRLYIKRLSADGAPIGTLKAFASRQFVYQVGGHLLPVLLLGAGLWLDNALVMGLAGFLVAASGWWMKLILITKAAYNQGFALPRVPVRGQGRPGESVKPGWAAHDRLTPSPSYGAAPDVNRSLEQIRGEDSRLQSKPSKGFVFRRSAP
ncbi:MAG: phenylacetyl CoA [Rhodospirillales bacterium]|nr:phenylacetyl CoA [Rhodospirillales bacterium]